ncbi:MAG: RNA polymerase sigma factor [Nanoarchaeota archaeon]
MDQNNYNFVTFEQAIQDYLAGNEKAIEPISKLCEIYSKRIASRYGKVCFEDVAQESLLKIHKNAHTYDQNQPAKPWIISIVRNTHFDMVKKDERDKRRRISALKRMDTSRRFQGDSKDTLEDITNREEFIEELADREYNQEEIAKITRILETMNNPASKTFKDHHYNGLSYEEIARRENIPLGTVKSRINFTKKRIIKIDTENLKNKKQF